MSHVEELELEYLAGLRAALEPLPEDGPRIRRQLAAALAIPSQATPSPSSSPNSGFDTVRKLLGSRMAQLVGVALVSGALGHAVGYQMGIQRQAGNTTAHVATPLVAAEANPSVAPPHALNDSTSETTATVNAQGVPQDSNRAKRGMQSVAAAASNAPASSEDPLIEEMQLIRRAERAIRANNGLLALAILRDLDQRFSKSQLLEEREAARVMANCELNPPEVARDLGDKYLGRYPKSVYVDRIRSLCQRSDASQQSNVTESESSGN